MPRLLLSRAVTVAFAVILLLLLLLLLMPCSHGHRRRRPHAHTLVVVVVISSAAAAAAADRQTDRQTYNRTHEGARGKRAETRKRDGDRKVIKGAEMGRSCLACACLRTVLRLVRPFSRRRRRWRRRRRQLLLLLEPKTAKRVTQAHKQRQASARTRRHCRPLAATTGDSDARPPTAVTAAGQRHAYRHLV